MQKPTVTQRPINRCLAVAPMLDWTDTLFRTFIRHITHCTLLYTEMVTTWALLHGDRTRLLNFADSEHPIALQLGGNDPQALAVCAKIGQDWGYDEINLNLGCPSVRVSTGRFGACLMAEPALVADCVQAMRAAVSIPITVKHRIGINGIENYQALYRFVETLAQAGCETFIVHARQAMLQGLSPKENRLIPPLRYAVVHQLKQDFPYLQIILNGGINNLQQAAEQLHHVDGVMIGRAAYHNPWLLATADRDVFGLDHVPISRHAVIAEYLPQIAHELSNGVPLGRILRHLLGLFYATPGANAWRRYLSEQAPRRGAGLEVIQQALAQM